LFTGTRYQGLFRSIDNGENWIKLDSHNDSITCVLSILIAKNNDVFVGTSVNGIFLSNNNGDNWTAINNGIPPSSSKSTYALARNQNGYLFSGIRGKGVFRSSDYGNNWSQINVGLSNWYVYSLESFDNGHVYAGTESGLFFSENNGDSWIKLNIPSSPNCKSLAIDSTETDIFVGYYSLYHSPDSGQNWQNVNNSLPNEDVITVFANKDDNVFVGTRGGNSGIPGIYLSKNYGGGWEKVFSHSNFSSFRSFVSNSKGDIFVGTSMDYVAGRPYIYRSTDNGETWELFNNGLDNLAENYLELAVSPDDIIYVSGGGVVRLNENGDAWIPLNNGLSAPKYTTLAFDSTGGVLLGTEDGIYRSTDHGLNWIKFYTPSHLLSDPDVNSILVNSSNSLFAAVKGEGIMFLREIGQQWINLNVDLFSSDFIRTLALLPNGDIYAGGTSSIGIAFSADNGENWSSINTGLRPQSIQKISVSPNGYIYAALGGDTNKKENGGIYRSGEAIISNVKSKNQHKGSFSYFLFQNYPNPFNPKTEFVFEINKISDVEVNIYNSSGQLVRNLILEQCSPGVHKKNWDSKNNFNISVPSGIYIAILKTQDFVIHRKFLLIK